MFAILLSFPFTISEVVICIILVPSKRADDFKVWTIYNDKIENNFFCHRV